MKKILCSKKLRLVGIFLILFSLLGSSAFADRARHGHEYRGVKQAPRHNELVFVNHKRYHYRDGRFYKPGFLGIGLTISLPPIGAVVSALPIGTQTIIVSNEPYYYYENVYYRPCPYGYTVVSAPAVPVQTIVTNVHPQPVITTQQQTIVSPAQTNNDNVTINVPNANGSYTPVTLIKQPNGYIGPQGEYYPNNPTIEQLKTLYGK
ncbi:membrane protein [Candidatus Omnitrophus magneticus]|uniref:Membrane protein n=1 Tax=Candidatus Omnitrophus magneticus TaxID=1609969 RepID=A0A0F0CSD2_9BACT|nr:membrane protein [Candidatus Omnitrophus magneticus]